MQPAAIPLVPRATRLGALLLASACLARAADPIEEVGKTAAELVKTRAETVRLEQAWMEERALLTATLGALKERADRLTERRDHLKATTAEERAEVAGLNEKKAEARATLDATEKRLEALAAQLLTLRPRLPPRLADALEMSYRTLGAPAASPGERMQVVMTILNRCAQFNSTVTHGEEVVAVPGENGSRALEVIYWGLSHGYALDRPGGRAWLGAPGAQGWQWEPLEGAAPAVAQLMAIRLDHADPSIVAVPARLKPAAAR
ncbi:MAG TPA: DUF3450 family protein [Opitutaceae bacterium]|nr:DUF3450 family protein [Opitutaceae bacterium]